MKEYLTGLTNPDFRKLASSLQHLNTLDSADDHAKILFSYFQKETSDTRQPREFTEKELRNALYLGHIVELANNSPVSFAIKLADFFTNGLHRHLFLQEIDQMPEGEAKFKLQDKAERLRLKYEPVGDYLDRFFDRAQQNGSVVVSERGDKLLRSKIDFVRKWGFAQSV